MINTNRSQLELSSGGRTKRKRCTSEETDTSLKYAPHDSKRRKEMLALRSPISPVEKKAAHPNLDEINPLDTRIASSTIESQFSLEILLKHNELRLIDQELAKCQIALEQLRRCHLIPYPVSSTSPVSIQLNTTDGTGPALARAKKMPPCAPPFGVTDGPYTRHYAKWLIPDPIFDGDDWPGAPESRVGDIIMDVRASRHSLTGTTAKTAKPALRGTTGLKLQALTNVYPQAKDKVGPCVIRRVDGQTVKLVCLDCHRDNFSSTQGFINHCRIAHRRDFKSHEEAAVASGQVVHPSEMSSKEENQREGYCGSGVTNTSVPNGLVHPLVRSAPTGKEARDACRALLSRVADSKAMLRDGRLPGFTSIPKSECSRNILSKPPSHASRIPHLAELWNLKGCSGDMNDILEEVQLEMDSGDESTSDEVSSDENIDDDVRVLPNPDISSNAYWHRSPSTPLTSDPVII